MKKSTSLLFVALFIGCVIILSSCNELINKAKQLIPDAGSQYNAAEEFRRAQGDTTVPQRPYIHKTENETDYGKYVVKWEVTPNAIKWIAYDGETKKAEGSINLDENPNKIISLISDENGTKTVNIDELIKEVQKLIPDPGPQFNAAEELRYAQGKSDKIRPYAPKGSNTPNTGYRNDYYSCSWSSAPNATQYCVKWIFKGIEKTSGWIDKLEYKWLLPDETGKMEVRIFSKNTGGESQAPLVFDVVVLNKGKLIFLTHGLNSNIDCFKETVNSLNSNQCFEVTMKSNGTKPKITPNKPDIKKFVDEKTGKGINVLIRTEFSDNNLSFATQFQQLEQMVKTFEIDYTDVVFIGHSMGGLISVDQGMKYADRKKNQKIKVKIITVDTPYQPNNYAKYVWDPTTIPEKILGLIGTFVSKQKKGEAHRDLGGFADNNGKYALANLKKEWNNYFGNVALFAISVSMYSDWESRWSEIGDGVVDIPAQQGKYRTKLDNVGVWEKVKTKPTIFGKGISQFVNPFDIEAILNGDFLALLEAGGINDGNNKYYHSNTPSLPDVIKQIKEIIEE